MLDRSTQRLDKISAASRSFSQFDIEHPDSRFLLLDKSRQCQISPKVQQPQGTRFWDYTFFWLAQRDFTIHEHPAYFKFTLQVCFLVPFSAWAYPRYPASASGGWIWFHFRAGGRASSLDSLDPLPVLSAHISGLPYLNVAWIGGSGCRQDKWPTSVLILGCGSRGHRRPDT